MKNLSIRTGLITFMIMFCAILPGMAQTYMQYVDSADNYIRIENWEAAERMTIAALKTMPANKLNYLLWSNLGDIRTRQENYDGALEAFEIALAGSPANVKVLNNRAYTYMQMGNMDAALDDINESLKKDSIQEWPLQIRGVIELGKGRYDEAEKDFIRLKDIYPKNASAYSGLGKIEAIKGNGKESSEYFLKSLELEQDEETWLCLVMVNIESGWIPKAKEYLLTALKRYPRSGNLYLMRGVIHKKNYENEAAEIDKKIAVDYGADSHLVEKFFPNFKK